MLLARGAPERKDFGLTGNLADAAFIERNRLTDARRSG